MRTLHAYFMRELFKTFLLTATALTVLVVMGGGVSNIFRGEGMGASEMAKVFAFLAPVAFTMILPIAALFTAAITYGRAAADNELTACRAAGINIHRLLLAPAALGVAVAAITYLSWNYFIPQLSRQVDELARRDLAMIVLGEFQRNKALPFDKYRLTAESFEALQGDRRPAGAKDDHTYLWLRTVSFLEMQDDEPARMGTADTTIIDFDRSTRNPTIRAVLQGVQVYDVARRQAFQLQEQGIGPYQIPTKIKWKMKFQPLAVLREYVRNPMSIPEIDDRIWGLRRGLMEVFVADDVDAQLSGPDHAYRVTGRGDRRYEITAEAWRRSPDGRSIDLRKPTVVETHGDVRRLLRAESGVIELKGQLDRERPLIAIKLVDATIQRPGGDATGGGVVRLPSETLSEIEFVDQPQLAGRVQRFQFEDLLDPSQSMAWLPKRLVEARSRLVARAAEFSSELSGEIHFRASYAAGAVAIILLGAMLGIVFRGGQVLTAFGISCAPSAVVIIAGIVGRNLTDRPEHTLIGLSVMWGGVVALYAAVYFVGAKLIQR